VRGVRALARAAAGEGANEAEIVRGSAAAVRAAVAEDGLPPLAARGRKLQQRPEALAARLGRVAARAKVTCPRFMYQAL
jgi:hypothetical protein